MTIETFYSSDEWRKLRERLMLERVNEKGELICAHCGKPILKKYDCIGHHIEELTEDNVNNIYISLNPANVELIHFKCHNIIHKRFGGFKQEVYLVYGSPCAGKTTWVNTVADKSDLILDIDRLWEAICNSDRYHKPNVLKRNVFGIRDAIINQVRTRTGNWSTAYIIGSYPLRTERDRLCDMLRAEPVFIDTPRDECMHRAKNEEWKQYVKRWWENYTP